MADLKGFTFGTCEYEPISPKRGSLSPQTGVLNIILSFEEALKLNLAVDEGVRKLHKYKKSTTRGKRAALNLTVYFEPNRIAVNEAKLKP